MSDQDNKEIENDDIEMIDISVDDEKEEVSMTYNLPRGVYVADIVENTGAADAGIQQGDIIVAFDGEEITQMTQLQELLEYYAAGTSVEVTIMRQSDSGYQEKVMEVTLGYRTE